MPSYAAPATSGTIKTKSYGIDAIKPRTIKASTIKIMTPTIPVFSDFLDMLAPPFIRQYNSCIENFVS